MVEDVDAQAVGAEAVPNFFQRRIVGNGRERVFAVFRQLAAGEQIGDEGVEQPVVNQERFGRGEMLRRIALHAPQRGDGESSGETRQVQRPPCLKPSNRRYAGIEQGKVGEQHQIIAAAVRCQDGRRKTADQGDLRHNLRVLPDCQQRHQYDHRHHQHEHDRCGQQRMQFQRRQSGQIHHCHAEALQHQAVFAFAALQLPAADDRRQTRTCHGQITHFHRYINPLGGIAQEERQAEEQHHDTGFQQRITAQEPSNNGVSGEFEIETFLFMDNGFTRFGVDVF